MAKDKAVEAEQQATTEETPDYKSKVTVLHEKHAAYIEKETGIKVDPLAVFLVYSTRVAFRKTSDEYSEVKQAKIAAEAAAEKEREERKAAKAAEAEKRKAEKEAEAAKKAEEKAARDKAKAEEKAQKEAEKAEKEAEAAKAKAEKEAAKSTDGEAAKPAKGRRGKGKQTSAEAIAAADAETAAAKSPF